MGEVTNSEQKKSSISDWIIHAKVMYSLIFLSGAAALIYELIWFRMLNIIFGVSGFAVATVVSVFLLGIGIGSIIFGKLAEKTKNTLKMYAYIELGIAVFSILSFIIIQYTSIFDLIFFYSYNNLNLYLLSAVRFLITVIILIIPSIGIGGTIPLVAKYLLKSNQKLGSQFSSIYLINTLGAFVGTMMTGFVLVQYLGVTKTFFVAALTNVIIFLIIIIFAKRKVNDQILIYNVNNSKRDDEGANKMRIMLPILFLTGFITLGYELLWVRVLTNFGSATTFSFTLILGGFLIGFTSGGLFIAQFIDKIKKLLRHFALYSISIAIVGGLILYILSRLHFFYSNVTGTYQQLITESWLGFIFSVIISIFMGILFPLGVRLYVGNKNEIGKKIGVAYFINTLGAVFGSLATGFFLIPLLGIKVTATILISLNLMIAAFLIIKKIQKRLVPAAALIISVILLVFLINASSNTYHRIADDQQELYYAEGVSATVTVQSVGEGESAYKILYVDSQGVASTHPTGIIDAKMLAHLPLFLASEASNAVTVGYGSGGTSYSMLLHEVEVVALEIEERVIDASREFIELNHYAETNPSLSIIIDDARNYLNNVDRQFDIIVTDVTNLKYKSNPNLYTTDYFEIMRNKLTNKGIAAAWVPLGGLSFNDLQILTASFQSVYPHTTIWFFNREPTGFLILIGTPDKLHINIDELASKMTEPVAEDLRTIGINNEFEMAATLLLGERDVAKLVQDVQLHTDDRPILEFSDLEYYTIFNPFDNLEQLLIYQTELYNTYFTFSEEQETQLLENFGLGRVLLQHYIEER